MTGEPVEADPHRLMICELDGAELSDAAARQYAPRLAALADDIDPAWTVARDGASAAVATASFIDGREYECGFLKRRTRPLDWNPLTIVGLPAGGIFTALSLEGARLLCPQLLDLLDRWYGSAPRRIDATGGHGQSNDASRHERARERAYFTARAQLDGIFHGLPGRRHGEKHNKRVGDVMANLAVLSADDRVSKPLKPPIYGIASS